MFVTHAPGSPDTNLGHAKQVTAFSDLDLMQGYAKFEPLFVAKLGMRLEKSSVNSGSRQRQFLGVSDVLCPLLQYITLLLLFR